MKKILALLLCFWCVNVLAQEGWIWEERSPMPKAMSNNAVAEAVVDGVTYVYSFGGIDTTKLWSGISNSSFRYNTETDVWDTIPDLPLDLPVIAAGANTVNNKIYFIGGYTVFSNGGEASSEKVFIYDPVANTYSEGADIPVSIDDQVQCVWRDSLIYVVTGWNDFGNVNDVQIYDTYLDTWTAGTAVENTGAYKVFGGSGAILGDTIYYAGGAKETTFSFALTDYFRKGVINPENPSEITWTGYVDSLALGYRMAATEWKDQVLWFGGATTAYNFNGIAYNGSGGVPPLNRILSYNPLTDSLKVENDTIAPIMDMRGIARLDENTFMLVGGMGMNQQVQNKIYWLHYEQEDMMMTTIGEVLKETIRVYPTLVNDFIYVEMEQKCDDCVLEVWTLSGKKILEKKLIEDKINLSGLKQGMYLVRILEDGKVVKQEKVFRF